MYSRRLFLQSSGVLLSYLASSRQAMALPAPTKSAGGGGLQALAKAEARTLETMAEAMVPGARAAGVAQYVDKQLAVGADQSLLMLKYLGIPPPFVDFYKPGLQAAAQAAQHSYDKDWQALSAAETGSLLIAIANDKVSGWQGYPASFFFFVVRADACDVLYGTEDGFAEIGMPYRAHIAPVRNW